MSRRRKPQPYSTREGLQRLIAIDAHLAGALVIALELEEAGIAGHNSGAAYRRFVRPLRHLRAAVAPQIAAVQQRIEPEGEMLRLPNR